MSGKPRTLTRDEKAANLVMNYSMILATAFEEVFANLASTMTEAMVKGTAAMAEAVGESLGGTPREGEKGKAETKRLDEQVKAKASKHVKEAFAEMREKARSEIQLDDKSLKKLVRSPSLDKGIEIIERHEFGLPKLTERLSDEDFAAYVALFNRSDPELMKMSEELGEWRKSVPDLEGR